MFITDLIEAEIGIHDFPKGYSSDEDDQTVLKLSDMRKTRLTLSQLNKIRILNDVKKLEHAKKLETLSDQYAAPAAEGGI